MTQPVATRSVATELTVALIGNPNTGKSTLFNALSGGQARVGNFPGVTVEKKVGKWKFENHTITLIDLPGTYSLSPRSADEMVSVDVLLGRQSDVAVPQAVVCIVDSSNLERNLYLFSQIRDLNLPTVLVLNMWDLAASRGLLIQVEELQKRLGVTVVTTSAHRKEGIAAVGQAILEAAATDVTPSPRLFPEVFYEEVEKLSDWLLERGEKSVHFFLLERMLLDVRGASEEVANNKITPDLKEYLHAVRLRLAAAGCRIPAIETKLRYNWIRTQLDGVMTRSANDQVLSTSDRIDRILTHWAWGILVFTILMFLVFQAIYSWSGPFMDLIESFQGALTALIERVMPPGMLRSLLVDGLIAGVGSVIIFLPQIVALFAFIAIMEDCGYMARAAFLMDKLMTRIGLSGKSFLPLMSSFACAIPGVMATRVIENRRDRMVTMLVAPLMSCSARLPVYLLMIYTFIPDGTVVGQINLQGVVLFGMYSLGALVAIPVAWILKKTFFKGETPPFVMELPPYKWPSPRIVFDRVYDRAKAFVMRAGSLIFSVTVLVWALSYFPSDHTNIHQLMAQIESNQAQIEADEQSLNEFALQAESLTTDAPGLRELQVQMAQLSLHVEELNTLNEPLLTESHALAGELIRASFLGQMGRAIEPAVKPLGWDWRIGVGALASFPAREVIIATMGTIFSLGGDVEIDNPGLKHALMAATWPDGRQLITIPVALSIMVFFALCAQCGATLMVIRRETNSWRWPIFTFTYMTLLAYVAALLTYQIGTAISG